MNLYLRIIEDQTGEITVSYLTESFLDKSPVLLTQRLYASKEQIWEKLNELRDIRPSRKDLGFADEK